MVLNENNGDPRYSTVKPLQEDARPILPQKLRKQVQVTNDLEVLREFKLQPLLGGGKEEVAPPSWGR